MQVTFQNLGTVNKNMVDLGFITIYFSYETPVSYIYRGERVTRQNDWSTTTGKLLNECESDKSKRINGELFEQQLSDILSQFN